MSNENGKDFPQTLMRIELVRSYITEAPRIRELDNGTKLMTVVTIANPDPKAVDKEGNKRYQAFRVSVTRNITKTPWEGKAQKGDPFYMSGDAMMRIYESKSEKAPFGVGVELEVRFPTRFLLLCDVRDREEPGDEPAEKPAPRKKLAPKRKPVPVQEPDEVDDDELPEGLDD